MRYSLGAIPIRLYLVKYYASDSRRRKMSSIHQLLSGETGKSSVD